MSYESDYFDLTFTEAISIDDFDALSNRPSYNGTAMTHSTNVPLVKTATWDAKYDKPDTGIPKTDLASAVQTSLTLVEGITATAAELNTLDGITATTQELNYTDGVTSNIQTQLNAKMDKTNPTGTGTFSLNRKSGSTIGTNSFAEGYNATASGNYSHAEGYNTTASGLYSHAEGQYLTVSGTSSHAEGDYTEASGCSSHAEGSYTTASGDDSHAEGSYTTASGDYSHSEGSTATASGLYSHAEGSGTTASGDDSHAEGSGTTASGDDSHAEGSTARASGVASHAEGYYTKASSDNQHVQGKYNVEDSSSTYADIVGWGTSTSARKNISALTTGGDLRLKGDLYTSCSDDSTGGTSLAASIAAKQDTLVSGTNIKTINNNSILGSGNIDTSESYKVTLSYDSSTSTYSIDKTVAEILAAYNAGKYVYIQSGTYTNMPLITGTVTSTGDGAVLFSSVNKSSGQPSMMYVEANTYGTVTVGMLPMITNTMLQQELAAKQDTLVSGTNIKTINNNSILGSGNLTIEAGEAYTATEVQTIWDGVT